MRTTDFAECLSAYLTMYLPGEAGLSENTIMSYRDTFKLVLTFANDQCGLCAEKITLSDFSADFITKFLYWLETTRGCSTSTRNIRLSALRAFAKYASLRKPEYIFEYQRILNLRFKKKSVPMLAHLSPDMVKAVLDQTQINDLYGRRDRLLLSLMYDSGARVQEICNLRIGDIRLQKPYTVRLTGKGRKVRVVPIMSGTMQLLNSYFTEQHMEASLNGEYPLFYNHQRQKLTRAGVAYILKKYCDAARFLHPELPKQISPHVLRHSKAMHLLQAGINLVYIRDFLGHEHVKTTEAYAKADAEMRRKSIEKAQIRIDTELPAWTEDKSLMEMLTSLCSKN